MTITFSEYEKLPKSLINKNKEDLIPGKKYYIEDTKRKDKNLKAVYIGIFKHKSNGMNIFENVSYVVSPYGYTTGVPHGFDAKSGTKFFEVINRISDLSSSRPQSSSRTTSSSRARSITRTTSSSSRRSSTPRTSSSSSRKYRTRRRFS